MSVPARRLLIVTPLALATLIIPIALGGQSEWAVAGLAVVSAIMLLIDRSRRTLLLYFVVFISGSLAEAIAIHFGAWTYARPTIIGIPLWLPFVWGNAGLFIVLLRRFIDDSVN